MPAKRWGFPNAEEGVGAPVRASVPSLRRSCAMGPMPWGDSKGDIEDVKVFVTYWEKANPPVKP